MRSRALSVVVLAALAMVPALAQEQAQRRLVYNFTLGVQNDRHDTNAAVQYGNGSPQPGVPGAGVNRYGGSAVSFSSGNTDSVGIASDTGTIAVTVLGMRPDGGLFVNVSEAAQNYRKVAPADCAIYPTTKIACAGLIVPEEAAVISTLSPAFFDPSRLDSKNHWHEDGGIPGLSLDFTASAPSGSIVTIAEDKNVKFAGGLGGTAHDSATFTYDTVRRVTTELKAYDTERPSQGQPGQYSNIVYDITATLATDSGTTAKN